MLVLINEVVISSGTQTPLRGKRRIRNLDGPNPTFDTVLIVQLRLPLCPSSFCSITLAPRQNFGSLSSKQLPDTE